MTERSRPEQLIDAIEKLPAPDAAVVTSYLQQAHDMLQSKDEEITMLSSELRHTLAFSADVTDQLQKLKSVVAALQQQLHKNPD